MNLRNCTFKHSDFVIVLLWGSVFGLNQTRAEKPFDEQALEFFQGSSLQAPPESALLVRWQYDNNHYSEYSTKLSENQAAVIKTFRSEDGKTQFALLDWNRMVGGYAKQVKTEFQLEAFKAVIERFKDLPFRDYYSRDSRYRYHEAKNGIRPFLNSMTPQRPQIRLDSDSDFDAPYWRALAKREQSDELLSNLSSQLKASLEVQSEESLNDFKAMNTGAPIDTYFESSTNRSAITNSQRAFRAFAENPKSHKVIREIAEIAQSGELVIAFEPTKFSNPYAVKTWHLLNAMLSRNKGDHPPPPRRMLEQIDVNQVQSEADFQAVQAIAKNSKPQGVQFAQIRELLDPHPEGSFSSMAMHQAEVSNVYDYAGGGDLLVKWSYTKGGFEEFVKNRPEVASIARVQSGDRNERWAFIPFNKLLESYASQITDPYQLAAFSEVLTKFGRVDMYLHYPDYPHELFTGTSRDVIQYGRENILTDLISRLHASLRVHNTEALTEFSKLNDTRVEHLNSLGNQQNLHLQREMRAFEERAVSAASVARVAKGSGNCFALPKVGSLAHTTSVASTTVK